MLACGFGLDSSWLWTHRPWVSKSYETCRDFLRCLPGLAGVAEPVSAALAEFAAGHWLSRDKQVQAKTQPPLCCPCKYSCHPADTPSWWWPSAETPAELPAPWKQGSPETPSSCAGGLFAPSHGYILQRKWCSPENYSYCKLLRVP